MTRHQLQLISGAIVELEQMLSFDELCHAVNLQPDIVLEMVELEYIEPQGNNAKNWQFDSLCLKRMRIAASFYHDLEVNIQGVGLALDLLEKIDRLQQQLDTLQKSIT